MNAPTMSQYEARPEQPEGQDEPHAAMAFQADLQ